jgi:predicted enzyme related to lactoylglutathione lyase
MGNPVVHFEIGCRDREATEKFYVDLFGWTILREGPASMIPGGDRGIPGHITALGHEPHHYVTFYVEVEDIEAALEKAVSLGGNVLVPPVPIPPRGTFAWFADPEGNTIGLWRPE